MATSWRSTSEGANDIYDAFIASAEERAAKLRRDEEERKRPEQLARERALQFSDAVSPLFDGLERSVIEPESTETAERPEPDQQTTDPETAALIAAGLLLPEAGNK